MNMPGGEHAEVDDRKLLEYVLNEDHPIGKHHAFLFRVLLGIDRASAPVLKHALLQAARDGDAVRGQESSFGTKYEIALEMTGPRGRYTILSVWIVPTNDPHPRMITVYVA